MDFGSILASNFWYFRWILHRYFEDLSGPVFQWIISIFQIFDFSTMSIFAQQSSYNRWFYIINNQFHGWKFIDLSMIIYVTSALNFHVFHIFSVSNSWLIFDHSFNGKWLQHDLQNRSFGTPFSVKSAKKAITPNEGERPWTDLFWTSIFWSAFWRTFST